MVTIPEVVEKLIKESPFLEEGLYQGIINYSALARLIKPEIEKETFKEVTDGAIIMALKRLESRVKHRQLIKKAFKRTPDMIVRSNLMEYTILNSDFLVKKHQQMLEKFSLGGKYFLIITQGVFETTVIISQELEDKVRHIFQGEKVIAEYKQLSAITIRLPEEVVRIPGIYYFILKTLAWEGINLIEVASTMTEFTIILKEQDVDRAFSILKRMVS